jgi:ATP-dependent RNA helicase DDX24/MAK5
MKDYPIDNDYFDECKKRVSLAVKIDKMEHQMSKQQSTSSWYEKQAKILDIELDDEILKETYRDSDEVNKNKRKLQQMKQELTQMLGKIFYPKFMSRKYVQAENIEKILSINGKLRIFLQVYKLVS